MNYKVLYRKYRPDDFNNLIGQDTISKILMNSIKKNKISHAYIFSGPRGTGKTSTAKIFAKSINCLNSKDGIACGTCINCKNFNSSTDIIEIDAASNNGVDQIREITNNIKLAPSMSKYKVYIIDEVHMLSQSAFNALLLTLEEPPAHVIFILATTNIENVPLTILSRCQRFDFKKIRIPDIIKRLNYICEEEKIDITEDALNEIAYISDGGMRDALSMLDQLSKNALKITLDNVIAEVGSVSNKSIEKLLINIENNDYTSIINQINEYRSSSLDYKLIIKKLIDLATNKALKIIETGKFDRLQYIDYKNMVFELNECLNKININTDSYSLIELILLNYMTFKNASINKFNVVPKKPKITDKNSDNIIDIRINNCFVEATKIEKIKAIDLWNKFKMSDLDNKIKGLIIDSKVVLASANIFVLVASDYIFDEINENNLLISEKIKKMYDKKIKIIALSSEKWNNVSKKYIADIKNGIKYNFKEEIEKNSIELENLATEVFSSDKIEID